MDLLIATHNSGKGAEFARLLEGMELSIRTLNDLEVSIDAPEETGTTFVENALIKARYYHQKTGMLALADDDPAMVDLFDGSPYGPTPIAADEPRAEKGLAAQALIDLFDPLVEAGEGEGDEVGRGAS